MSGSPGRRGLIKLSKDLAKLFCAVSTVCITGSKDTFDLKKLDGRNKFGTQNLKIDFSRLIETSYYGKSSSQYANCLICLVRKKFDVDVSVYYTSFKIGTYFQLIYSTPAALSTNVVHTFNCLSDANCPYVSVIPHHLATRVRLHLHSTITKTHVTEHLNVCDSCKKNSNMNSLDVNRKRNTEHETKIHEALQSRKSIHNSAKHCMLMVLRLW